MTWGQQLQTLEEFEEKTGITPKGLASRPEVQAESYFYLDVFETLSASRGVGMGGPLPITLADVWAYCQLFEITDLEERAKLLRFLQELDQTYLAKSAETATNGMSVVSTVPPAAG